MFYFDAKTLRQIFGVDCGAIVRRDFELPDTMKLALVVCDCLLVFGMYAIDEDVLDRWIGA